MNKLSITVLSALALLGVAFPATVALANRPAHAVAPVAISAEPVRHAVSTVVVEDLGSSYSVVLDEVKVAPSRKAHRAAKPVRTCRRIALEQQGRPGAQSVLMCG